MFQLKVSHKTGVSGIWPWMKRPTLTTCWYILPKVHVDPPHLSLILVISNVTPNTRNISLCVYYCLVLCYVYSTQQEQATLHSNYLCDISIMQCHACVTNLSLYNHHPGELQSWLSFSVSTIIDCMFMYQSPCCSYHKLKEKMNLSHTIGQLQVFGCMTVCPVHVCLWPWPLMCHDLVAWPSGALAIKLVILCVVSEVSTCNWYILARGHGVQMSKVTAWWC